MTARPPDPSPDSPARTVPPLTGERLDKHLASLCPEHSRASIQRMISDGSVRVNGLTVQPSYRLKSSDILEVYAPVQEPRSVQAAHPELSILFEDAHILALDKPAGISTHPGPGHDSGTLADAILDYCPGISNVGDPARPGIVHRLDKDTSGLLLVAKTPDAHTALSAQFKKRTVEKTYMALVQGVVSPPEGIIEAPLGRHPRRRKEMAVVQGGRESITHYRTTRTFAKHTLLEVSPRTGRTHQIRVHLAAIGHLVCGDAVYGKRCSGPGRHFLHAAKLTFLHPASGRRMELISALPSDLAQFLDSLESGGC